MRGILGTIALVALTGWGFSGVKGDGNIQQQTRKVGEFRSVGVSHGIHARVKVGSPASATLKGDANLLALVELELQNGTLQTVIKGNESLRPSQEIVLEVTAPTLEGVHASGGAEVVATAAATHRFKVSASGGGVVKVSSLSTGELEVSSSGGADVTVSGDARRVEIESSGGAEVHATQLVCDEARVDGSGGAEVEVHARQRVSGQLSGGAELTVEGNPAKRSISTSGGGEAHFKS